MRQQELEPLYFGQTEAFLDACRGDRYEALYVLCLMAALWQGEALELKWSNIDLEARPLQVNRQLQHVRRDDDKSGKLEFSEPKNASVGLWGFPKEPETPSEATANAS